MKDVSVQGMTSEQVDLVELPIYPLHMEVDVELDHKTTILLTSKMHARLGRLARQQGTSMGELIRRACEIAYGERDVADRMEAVHALEVMELPVADTATMKRQSVPAEEPLP